MLTRERQAIPAIYDQLRWEHTDLEQVITEHRDDLPRAGIRLHVATKDVASGPRWKYVEVDDKRYGAIGCDTPLYAKGRAMNWTYIQKLEAYFADTTTYRCRVYHDPPTWLAIVTCEAAAIVQEGFPSAEAAIARARGARARQRVPPDREGALRGGAGSPKLSRWPSSRQGAVARPA